MSSDIESNEESLLKKLMKFYKSDNQYLKILASISGQKTIISLREMDFLVTKYSKKKKISYKLSDGSIFNVHIEYRAQLRGHSKKRFDPFCRLGDTEDTSRLGRFFIFFDSKQLKFLKTNEEVEEYRQRTDGVVTNVGQMNFFKWAIVNNLIDYCFQHKADIVSVMDEEYKSKKTKKAEKTEKVEKTEKTEKAEKTKKSEKSEKIIIQFP